MKQHNTTTTTIPEQFNRLPEPWRSKAIARCEAFYGKKLDEIDTIFYDLDGKPFGFLQCAFPWQNTPEGHAVWEAISERGEFPPSYRLLNPGEIILASDEVYLRGEWEEMAGDTGVGETFDPEEAHPIRRRIKSYEDA